MYINLNNFILILFPHRLFSFSILASFSYSLAWLPNENSLQIVHNILDCKKIVFNKVCWKKIENCERVSKMPVLEFEGNEKRMVD